MATVSGIYAITDPVLLPGDHLFSGVAQALGGGIRLIQYRDKTATREQQLQRARELVRICRDHEAQLIVNDGIDVALESGAAGVHLGQEDDSVTLARQRMGSAAIIGATCHDQIPLARRAHMQGASYVAFGRFFPSETKPDAPCAPIAVLRQAIARIPCPTVAIGGINTDNMQDIIRGGAHAVALCHSLFANQDIGRTARHLVEMFNEHSPRN